MFPAFKPLPKVHDCTLLLPRKGRAPYIVGCVAEIAIGLVRCLCTHAQLSAHLRIERCVAWRASETCQAALPFSCFAALAAASAALTVACASPLFVRSSSSLCVAISTSPGFDCRV